jgi:hypothetical protein
VGISLSVHAWFRSKKLDKCKKNRVLYVTLDVCNVVLPPFLSISRQQKYTKQQQDRSQGASKIETIPLEYFFSFFIIIICLNIRILFKKLRIC